MEGKKLTVEEREREKAESDGVTIAEKDKRRKRQGTGWPSNDGVSVVQCRLVGIRDFSFFRFYSVLSFVFLIILLAFLVKALRRRFSPFPSFSTSNWNTIKIFVLLNYYFLNIFKHVVILIKKRKMNFIDMHA